MRTQQQAHVIQVIGYRDSGKTTLICHLVKALTEQGWRVGTIKHDAHQFEIDYPGKDTWKHRMAGAEVVAITAKDKTAIMRQQSTPIDELLRDMADLDLVLVEGFKAAPYPKIVLIRTEDQLPLLKRATNIIAVVSWIPIHEESIPYYDKDDLPEIETEVLKQMKEED